MKYRHIVVTHRGGPEVLQVVENNLSKPLAGEARVKVLAAGVAFGDVIYRAIYRRGMPNTPGYDIIGVVDKLGAGVTTLAIGQVVAALLVRGGYTEYTNIPFTELVPVPAGLDPVEAVCLVLNYVTAYQLLHRVAHVQKGQRILIHGASGGIGTALLQLGRIAELEMYGTASKRKHQIIIDLGGIPLEYGKEDMIPCLHHVDDSRKEGIDVVLDAIGGITHLYHSYRSLRDGGKLVVYGFSGAVRQGKVHLATILANAALLGIFWLTPGKSVMWYTITHMKNRHPEWYREDLMILFDWLKQKRIQPLISRRLSLTQAAQAHTLLERSAVTGKIVLVN